MAANMDDSVLHKLFFTGRYGMPSPTICDGPLSNDLDNLLVGLELRAWTSSANTAILRATTMIMKASLSSLGSLTPTNQL